MNPVLLIYVALAGVLWLVFVQPQRRNRQKQKALHSSLSVGEDIVTVGGIYGTIVALDDDEIRLEVAPDVVIRVARRAIAARVGLDPSEAYVDDDDDAYEADDDDHVRDEHDHDEHDDDGEPAAAAEPR